MINVGAVILVSQGHARMLKIPTRFGTVVYVVQADDGYFSQPIETFEEAQRIMFIARKGTLAGLLGGNG